MKQQLKCLWWRLSGVFVGVFSMFFAHGVAQAGFYQGDKGSFYMPDGDGSVVYDADDLVWYNGCKFEYGTEDGTNYCYADNNGGYACTTHTVANRPWWCAMYAWADESVKAETIEDNLGADWNSLAGKYIDKETGLTDNATTLQYDVVAKLASPRTVDLDVFSGASTSIGMVDYGFAYTTMFRIIGCTNGRLSGATSGSYVNSLDTVTCVADTPCTQHLGDDDRAGFLIYHPSSDMCYFRVSDADAAEESLYDAAGKFIYINSSACNCFEDGTAICS